MGKGLDLLKSALAQRQAKAQKTIAETGQKWVRRGDLEEKRKQEYLEEKAAEDERQKALEEERLASFDQHYSRAKSKLEVLNKADTDEVLLQDALLDDDEAEPPLSLAECVDRLRELGQPITLFGETNMQRYKRLKVVQKEGSTGKTNPDVLMLEQVNESQRFALGDQDQNDGGGDGEEDEDEDEGGGAAGGRAAKDDDDKSDSEDEAAPAAGDDKSDSEDEAYAGGGGDKSDSEDEQFAAGGDKSDSEDEAMGSKAPDKAVNDEGTAIKDKIEKKKDDLPDLEVNSQLMDKCDFIRTWVRKSQKAWEKELADKPDAEKVTAKVKQEVAAHRQVRRDVRPLQRRLKIYVMDGPLLEKIHSIVKQADEREYREAASLYLDLTIGKAAWPVGIGCGGSMLMEDAIGLHDRFNRMANRKDNAVTLNDDVTRKFVQALKRLMNVAQRYWPPTDPSKSG